MMHLGIPHTGGHLQLKPTVRLLQDRASFLSPGQDKEVAKPALINKACMCSCALMPPLHHQ